MNFLPPKIEQYANEHSEPEDKLLEELSRETWQKVLNPRMLSGAFQGNFLSFLSKLLGPKCILEIGTYTGYATICLAKGLQKKGIIHTLEMNEELTELQNKYFEKSGYRNQIKQYVGNALKIIPNLDLEFDMVFIDADKKNYIRYFNLIIGKMKKGGVIVSDNVLWSGKVAAAIHPKDEDTKILDRYNKMLKNHPLLETLLLPIRDGLHLSRVK